MTTTQKTILFWLGAVLGAVVIVFFLVLIQHKRDEGVMGNQVAFTGEGKVSVKPELAIVEFSIVTSGKTSKIAQDANAVRSKKVYDFLKKQGVDEKDIKTTYYNMNPQYSYPTPYPYPVPMMRDGGMETQVVPQVYPVPIDSTSKITGYEVMQGYEVKVRDLEKASAIVDGLVTAGANQVQNVRFDFEDREKLMSQARDMAIKDAKDKADKLKSQLGIRLGKILNYYDNTDQYGGPYPYAKMGFDERGGGDGYGGVPVLPPGENEITVQVTITYQIK